MLWIFHGHLSIIVIPGRAHCVSSHYFSRQLHHHEFTSFVRCLRPLSGLFSTWCLVWILSSCRKARKEWNFTWEGHLGGCWKDNRYLYSLIFRIILRTSITYFDSIYHKLLAKLTIYMSVRLLIVTYAAYIAALPFIEWTNATYWTTKLDEGHPFTGKYTKKTFSGWRLIDVIKLWAKTPTNCEGGGGLHFARYY